MKLTTWLFKSPEPHEDQFGRSVVAPKPILVVAVMFLMAAAVGLMALASI